MSESNREKRGQKEGDKQQNRTPVGPAVWPGTKRTQKSMCDPLAALQLNQCPQRRTCCRHSSRGFYSMSNNNIDSRREPQRQDVCLSVNNHCQYCGWSDGKQESLKVLHTFQSTWMENVPPFGFLSFCSVSFLVSKYQGTPGVFQPFHYFIIPRLKQAT